jgi:hypothetical protein
MFQIALSLQYIPKNDVPLNLLQRLSSIDGSLGIRLRQKLLFELSLNYIRHRMSFAMHCYAHIQAITLLLVYDQNGEALKVQLYDHAVRASQQLGLHSIEFDDGSSINEVKARTWWFLVTRNWFASLSTSIYSIHPHQFSTRMPVEVAYLDLPPDQPDTSKIEVTSVYLPIRYSLTLIQMADMIRRLVDHRREQRPDFEQVFQDHFERFEEKLPDRYSLATVGENYSAANIYASRSKLERWILHQLLFHAYLELYQFEATKVRMHK